MAEDNTSGAAVLAGRSGRPAGDEDLDAYTQDVDPEEQVRRLRVIVRQTRDERWDAMAKAEAARKKLARFGERLVAARDELKRFKFTVGKLRAYTGQLDHTYREEFTRFQAAVSAAVASHVQRAAAGITCTPRCGQLEAIVADLNKQVTDLAAEYDKVKFFENSQAQAMASLRQQVKNAQADMDRAAGEARARDTQSQHKIKSLGAMVNDKESELQKQRCENEDLRQRLEVVKRDDAEARRRLEVTLRKNPEVDNLKRKLKNVEEELERSKEEKTLLQQHLASTRKSMEDLSKQQAQSGGLLKEVHNKEEEVSHLKETVSKLSSALTEERRKMTDDFAVQLEEHKTKVNQKARKAQMELEAEKQRLYDQINRLTESGKTNEAKLQAAARAQQARLRDKVEDLTLRLARARDDAATTEHRLRDDIERLKGKLADRQQDREVASLDQIKLSSANEKLEEKRREIMVLRDEKRRLKQRISELEKLVKKEVEERQELTDDLAKAKRTIHILKTPKRDVNAMKLSQSSEAIALLRKQRQARLLNPSQSEAVDLNELRTTSNDNQSEQSTTTAKVEPYKKGQNKNVDVSKHQDQKSSSLNPPKKDHVMDTNNKVGGTSQDETDHRLPALQYTKYTKSSRVNDGARDNIESDSKSARGNSGKHNRTRSFQQMYSPSNSVNDELLNQTNKPSNSSNSSNSKNAPKTQNQSPIVVPSQYNNDSNKDPRLTKSLQDLTDAMESGRPAYGKDYQSQKQAPFAADRGFYKSNQRAAGQYEPSAAAAAAGFQSKSQRAIDEARALAMAAQFPKFLNSKGEASSKHMVRLYHQIRR